MTAIKIMLDPGHDRAKYNQSPVVPGYWEGERMWKLYQLLRVALEKKGFIVGGTKTKCDQAVSVNLRGAMARGCACLISLHSNACSTESVDRPVGIYFVDDDCGKIDDTSKELAVLLSKVVADTMGTSQPQQYSRLSKNDRDYDGKKNDDYYGVLFGAHQVGVPAIILENSFHTNRRAAEWLLKDSNLEKLAQALADELAAYYGVTGPTVAPAPTTKEGTPVYMKTLKKGSKGAQVKALQALLIGYGYKDKKGKTLSRDGSFGANTDFAVRNFQSRNKLDPDGIVGDNTWAKLLGQTK